MVQRKVPTPNDIAFLDELRERLLVFQHHYEPIAQLFKWKFTKSDLHALLARIFTRQGPWAAKTS